MKTALRALVIAAVLAAAMAAPAGAGSDDREQEKVIGPDTRRRVDPTTGAVARRTVLITFTFGGQGHACTGFLVEVDLVATAGHCVFDFDGTKTFAKNIEVTPGANGGSTPYGTCGAAGTSVPAKWQSKGSSRWDIGAIELDCDVGQETGVMPLQLTGDPLGDKVRINGYPGDKPARTQWTGSGRVVIAKKQQLFYDVDTTAGQSGAPITNKKLYGCVCAVGIHTSALEGAPRNAGVRVSANVIGWFAQVQ
jgi:glutamyl endopeptidase